jgi:hypothetical protein
VQPQPRLEGNLQMLRQLLSADIHGSCGTGSTLGGHAFGASQQLLHIATQSQNSSHRNSFSANK